MTAQDRWAQFFAAAVVAATFANGAAAYLKRIGVLEHERYESYWQIHCGGGGPVARVWGFGRRCTASEPGPLDTVRYRREEPHFFFVFEVRPSEAALKLAKDAVMLLFVGVSLWQARHLRAPRLVDAWPAWGLCTLVFVAAVWGIARGEGLKTLMGLRGMTFIATALFGVWMTDVSRLQRVCRALVVLLVLQLLLVPAELLWGMPMAGYSSVLAFPSRIAGTLVKPNSLGVLAAITVALAEVYAPDRRWRIAAWVSGILVILFAGSATGWMVLFSLVVFRVVHRQMTWKWVAALSLIGALLLLTLPRVVGRPNLLDSLTGPMGRLDLLRGALSSGDSILLGRGLGAGTNTEQVLASQRIQLGPETRPGSDSTAILLLGEIGVFGVLLFYAALAMGWHRQRRATPIFIALGLTSLTFTLPEAFPTNLVLGLALAHGCARPPSVMPP